MSTTRAAIETRVRTLINDMNPHQYAISGRRMAEMIEQNQIEIIEELPLEVTRTSAAITLATGDSRKAFLPAVDISNVAGVILDSINKPLVQTPLEVLLSLRVGQTPARSTYPWRYAMEEDETGTMYVNVWPDYQGSGDTLTTIVAKSGTTLSSGLSVIQLAIQGQVALALRTACDCVSVMTDQQLSERRINRGVIDPSNPRSWIAKAEKAYAAESARLSGMDSQGEIVQYGAY